MRYKFHIQTKQEALAHVKAKLRTVFSFIILPIAFLMGSPPKALIALSALFILVGIGHYYNKYNNR